MSKNTKVWAVLFLIALTSSFAAALERPAAVQSQAAGQSVSGPSQDVITASDAGGGYLSNRDILLIVLIVLAIFGLAAIL